MKKLLFLISPFLFPLLTNAQFVGESRDVSMLKIRFGISGIVLLCSFAIFVFYLSQFSTKKLISAMLKTLYEKEVLILSMLSSSFLVLLSSAMKIYSSELAYIVSDRVMVFDALTSSGIAPAFYVAFFLLVPLYFAFTKGWRHFLASFFDITVFIILLFIVITM